MTERVRFVHCADLHLDAPFQGVSATDDRVRQALVSATYEAFSRVVDVCLERDAEFLLIAGDTYNSRDKSLKSQLAFQGEIARLGAADIPVFIAQGNHDPADGWSATLAPLQNLTYFPVDRVGRIEVHAEGEVRCVLYGRGFKRAAETANYAREFRRTPEDGIAIGVLHTNVGGNTDYEPYAPCTVEDLRSAGMDYWALGHIHKPGRVCTEPLAVYSGSPQGLNPKETGAHGCYVVEVSDGIVAEEFVPCASVGWASSAVNVDGLESLSALSDAIRAGCEALRAASAVPLIARIDLVGRSAVHSELVRGTTLPDLLDSAREEQLSGEPWLWIDRLRDKTSPELDLDEIRATPDFTSDLVRLADELLEDESAAEELIREIVEPLEGTIGAFDAGMDSREIVERARDICLDRLLEGAEG